MKRFLALLIALVCLMPAFAEETEHTYAMLCEANNGANVFSAHYSFTYTSMTDLIGHKNTVYTEGGISITAADSYTSAYFADNRYVCLMRDDMTIYYKDLSVTSDFYRYPLIVDSGEEITSWEDNGETVSIETRGDAQIVQSLLDSYGISYKAGENDYTVEYITAEADTLLIRSYAEYMYLEGYEPQLVVSFDLAWDSPIENEKIQAMIDDANYVDSLTDDQVMKITFVYNPGWFNEYTTVTRIPRKAAFFFEQGKYELYADYGCTVPFGTVEYDENDMTIYLKDPDASADSGWGTF